MASRRQDEGRGREREKEREIRTYGIARGLTRDTDYEVIVTSLACHLSVHRSARTEQPLPVRYRGKYLGHVTYNVILLP